MKTNIFRALAARLARALCLAALWCLVAPSDGVDGRTPSPRLARPQASRADEAPPAPLVVVGPRGRLSLDGKQAGTLRRTSRLTKELAAVFRLREAGGPVRRHPSPPDTGRGAGSGRAVIVMASSAVGYADVLKVVEAVKQAGASSVKLVSNEGELRAARRELAATPAPSAMTVDSDPGRDSEQSPDASANPDVIKESSLIVAIAPDNQLYINRRLVTLDGLEAEVRSLTSGLPEAEKVVYIKAHLDAPYGLVVRVIETVRKAGVIQIGLVTDKRPPQ